MRILWIDTLHSASRMVYTDLGPFECDPQNDLE